MTDARLPERWFLDLALVDLTPTAWRFFTFALMFCNAQGTDGRMTEGQLRFIPVEVTQQDISDVVATGRLKRISGGYQFQDWSTALGQSTAASVEARRELNRQRQAKHRESKKQPPQDDSVTRDVTRDAVGQDTTGKGRPGQEEIPPAEVEANPATGEVTSWVTAVPGRSQDEGYCRDCGRTSGHTPTCQTQKENAA